MNSLLREIGFALRVLRRSPAFALVAVVTLGLGIGANSALFSVVNAVFLRPLPYPESDRLVLLWGSTPNIPKEEASLLDFTDWKAQSRSFEGMAAARFGNVNVTGEADPERVTAARVTHDFLEVLRVAPELGRGFSAEEDRPGAGRVAILSHGFWQRRFGSDPSVLGQVVRVNDENHTIVGVLPAAFRLPVSDAAIYLPLAVDPATTGRRSDSYVVAARLKPGVGVDGAQAEMTGIAERLARQYPQTNATWTVRAVPMLEDAVGEYRLALGLLCAAVGCVLLIACANVANLLLARGTARHRELAIRAALGAGRLSLVRQLLIESATLAVLAGALGLLVAVWGKEALLSLSPVAIPRIDEATLDTPVLAFTLGLSLLTAIVFGLVPTLHAVRAAPQSSLQEGGRGIAGDTRGRARSLLVVAQLGLALVLLVGTGLAIRSFARVREVAPGFDTGPALTARVSLPVARYRDDAAIVSFYSRLEEQLAGLQGVKGVTFAAALPIVGGGPFLGFNTEGVPAPPPGSTPDANVRIVDHDYFALMGVPLRAGRLPTAQDRAGSPRVLVVNETLARQIGQGGSPIGKRIAFDADPEGRPNWWEIVGVVGDVKHEGLDRSEVRAAYPPLAQAAAAARSVSIVLRTAGAPEALAAPLLASVRAIDPTLPVYSVRTMEEILSQSLQARRFAMLLLGFFGIVALVLAGVGIYSVMSYTVSQRRHEIGIRMALGAARRDVVRMVVRQGMFFAVTGLVSGTAVALGGLWFASSLLFEVSPFDPLAFAFGILLLGTISLAACFVPAARASRVDPMVALRHD